MTVKFTNNASTTIGTGINASATSLTVASASSFPSLSGADDYCYLTLQGATNTTREVVKATALSSNTFTIVRAQDNTSAASWVAGDVVELRMTAALLTDVIDAATVEGVKTNYQYTPTAGQTVFSGADNASATMIINQAALVSVYMNGVRLVQGTDYSVSSANNTVTLGIGATTADIIDIEVYGNFVGQSGAAVGITGGSITGTAITATSLGATGTATLNTLVSNNATISGGSLDGVTIGGTTRGAISGNAISGTSFASTGNMTFGDNDKAIFGAGSDLQIYHSGTHSFIEDKGTGNLYIDGASSVVIRGETANTISAIFNDEGSVVLKHNGDTKLSTTASGIDVTGSVTADTSLNIEGTYQAPLARFNSTSGFARITLQENGNARMYMQSLNGSDGVKFMGGDGTSERLRIDPNGKILIGDSASHTSDLLQIETPASGGGHGIQIRRNDSNTDQTVGSITFGNNTATDVASISAKTDGATDNGALLFNTSPSGGSNTERMRINSSGNVGIGGSPNYPLTIGDGTDALETVNIVSTDAGSSRIFFSDASGVGLGRLTYDHSDNHLEIYTADTEAMRIDASGNVGIGVSGPSYPLQVGDGTDALETINIRASDTGQSRLFFSDLASNGQGRLTYDHANNSLQVFTADTERMRIDASGTVKVGLIGTQSSPLFSARKNGANIEFGHNNTTSGYFGTLGSSANNGRPYLGFSAHADSGSVNTFTTHGFKGNVIQSDNSGNLGFFQLTNADASGQSLETRMTLDASGNLLLNRTSAFTTAKMEIQGDAGDASTLALNSIDTDGSILGIYRAGNSVGSIGVASSDNMYITSSATNHVGLYLGGGGVLPMNSGSLDTGDNVDIGSPNYQFADLHLAGGVVFGTTGGAVTSKTLDDYEAGLWTPVLSDGTTSYTLTVGHYTRVGRVVTVTCQFSSSLSTTATTSVAYITGLPFSNGTIRSVGAIHFRESVISYDVLTDGPIIPVVNSSSSIVDLIAMGSSGDYQRNIPLNELVSTGGGSSNYITFTATYQST